MNFLKFKGTERFTRQPTSMKSNQTSNMSIESSEDVIDVVKQVLFEELKIDTKLNGSENKFKTIRRSQMKIRQSASIPNLSITYSSFSQNNDIKRGFDVKVKPGHVTRLVTKFEE